MSVQFSIPGPKVQLLSRNFHSLDILINVTIIPSVFSTLQLRQQDLIKGLYFSLDLSNPCFFNPSLGLFQQTAILDTGVILFSINFFCQHDCHRLVTCRETRQPEVVAAVENQSHPSIHTRLQLIFAIRNGLIQ